MEMKNESPPVKKTLELLNSAFDGWGDEEYFKWKFYNYPDFKEGHNYFFQKENGVIAFTRLFHKELNIKKLQKNHSVFIWGDSVVAERHRGKGLFSQLIDFRNKKIDKENYNMEMAFVRKGNVPYHVHLKDGWNFKELPLHIRILSPSKVIKEYAGLVLNEKEWLENLLGMIGDRIHLDFEEETIYLSELAEKNNEKDKKFLSFGLNINNQMTKNLIEAVVNEKETKKRVSEVLKLPFQNKLEKEDNEKTIDSDVKIEHKDDLTEEEIFEIEKLYDRTLREYDIHFRREKKDIHHLLEYPYISDIILVKKDDIEGFAVLGKYPQEGIKEIRVLELLHKDEEIFKILENEIERSSKENEADLILMISEQDSSGNWADINKQVVMWDSLKNEKNLRNLIWKVSFYDIV